MRQKKHEIVSFKRRTISLLLALAVVISSLTFGAVTIANAAETLYFDTSQNTAWNPGSGEKLYATFTDSGGNKVDGTVELTSAGTNLYRVSAPTGAANIQLYLLRSGYTMPDTVPGSGKTRVFLKNNANWNPPYAYAWTNGGEMTWPGAQMTKVSSGSTYWYYYDTPYSNVIFGNGTGTSSPQQSADLAITGKNLIFSKYNGNSGWDSAPYYKKYAEMSLGSRPSGANEMYALSGDEVKFSKYPYSSRSYGSGKDIYLYNPDWTDASKVKVSWDFTDPYHTTLPMSTDDENGDPLAPGFYYANVPSDAVIQFSYDYAYSQQTEVPSTAEINCFKMKNGSGHWVKLSDALGETTDYQAPVEPLSNPTNSKDAYWVDAVYYDYLSDYELDNGWLNPRKAGTFNFNGAQDTWYEHNVFNGWIGDYADAYGATFPLYFGNYCNTPKAYGYDNYEPHNGPFVNRSAGLTNFYYYVNNSNGLTNRHYAVRGLAADSLDDSGNIRYSSGASMPYFDSEWLRDTTKDGASSSRSLGKSVNSAFPFRTTDLGSGVTKYSFDSQGAKDNVFFNWSGGAPVSVGYGQGTGYGIKDGISDFMYNEQSGYGIFPFNTTSNPSTNGRGGNSNLDYGFGVKMQMDFRVPEGGVLPNGDDCTFSFSGDDDLWVYISEYNEDGTLGDSILSLDLGGNHKKAEGVINFKTMQYSTTKIDNSEVTKAAVATTNPNFKSDTMYIIDSDNWGDVWIYAWEGGSNKWFHCGKENINGTWYYTAKYTDFGGYTNFKCTGGNNNWTHQSASDCKIKAQFGNICYANNPNHCEENASDFSRTTTQSGLTYEDNNVKHAFGFESNGSGGYLNLDPSKTYHMSVFYMERGYIESNCKIEFTMTPAQNDVKVHKEVDTANVNSGLKSDLQTGDFKFKNYENNTLNKTARYTLNNSGKYRVGSSDGGYLLSHQDTADFDNQYMTGSELKVTETKPSDGISYGKTYWEVINLADGERLHYGTDSGHPHTDTSTRAFKLENTNKNSYVTRQVNFVNTPDVTDLTISKAIVDKAGSDLTDVSDDFSFKLLVDLNDGEGFKERKLTYTVSSEGEDIELTTGNDGTFRFSSADSVVFEGMPVGANYMLKELFASGYKPYRITVGGVSQDYSGGEYYGEFDNDDVYISVTNMQQLISTTLEAEKMISMGKSTALYSSGDLFTFRAQGLGETVYNTSGDKTVDIHDMVKDVDQTDVDGKVRFENDALFLKFTKAGVYALKMFEYKQNDVIPGGKFYDDDFTGLASNQYIALITVEDDPANPGAFTVSDPEYYSYDGTSTIGASTFTEDKKTDMPVFFNPVRKGKVTVTKADNRPEVEDRNKLKDVSFMLYKVDNTEPATGEDLELINPHDGVEVFTNENGVAEFSDLDIFKTTGSGTLKVAGAPEYQMYALSEIDTLDDHFKSRVVQIFSLPIADKSGVPQYEIKFDYVNGVIKAPETAGPGIAPFTTVGLIVVIFACASLLAYVLYFRKKGFAFASRGKHYKK